jgi:hypothetical protein
MGVDSGGYGVFSSYNAGRNSLVADLSAKVRKYGVWTLYQVMARYAPPSENNTQAYAAAVASALRVSTTTLVNAIAGVWSSQGLAWTPLAFANGGAPSIPTAPPASSPDVPADPFTMSTSDLLTQTVTGFAPGSIDLSGDTSEISSADISLPVPTQPDYSWEYNGPNLTTPAEQAGVWVPPPTIAESQGTLIANENGNGVLDSGVLYVNPQADSGSYLGPGTNQGSAG